MAWQKPPPSLLTAFEQLLPNDPRIERRKMFGLPCAFVNGNMSPSVHEASIVLRMSETERAAAKREIGAQDFAPMGRLMREYVNVAEPDAAHRAAVATWIARSLAYAAALPAKQAKQPKPKPKPKKPAGKTTATAKRRTGLRT